MEYQHIEVKPYENNFGAEILGVDVNNLHDEQWNEIKAAFTEYSVIFFRGQEVTPKQHIAFANKWAPIAINRYFKHVQGYPEISEVKKEAHELTNIGGSWHTDRCYDAIPAMASILVERELPPVGGDTLFLDMYRSFDALPMKLKQQIIDMKAIHSSTRVFGNKSAHSQSEEFTKRYGNWHSGDISVAHPVVISHPESKRNCLFINPGFTFFFEHMSEEESALLFSEIYRYVFQPEHQCRFKWEKGSIAMWDNRSTMHYAMNDYHGHRRVMHRISVAGKALTKGSI